MNLYLRRDRQPDRKTPQTHPAGAVQSHAGAELYSKVPDTRRTTPLVGGLLSAGGDRKFIFTMAARSYPCYTGTIEP